MKQIFNLTQQLNPLINDPKIVAIIKEVGGKMHLREKRWDVALNEFRECFQCLIESGNPRAHTVLKYAILSSLLAKPQNRFLNTRPYSDDSEIVVMAAFKKTFETNNFNLIEEFLGDKDLNKITEPVIAAYRDDLLKVAKLNALQIVRK